jgi:hypothetical protein
MTGTDHQNSGNEKRKAQKKIQLSHRAPSLPAGDSRAGGQIHTICTCGWHWSITHHSNSFQTTCSWLLITVRHTAVTTTYETADCGGHCTKKHGYSQGHCHLAGDQRRCSSCLVVHMTTIKEMRRKTSRVKNCWTWTTWNPDSTKTSYYWRSLQCQAGSKPSSN